MERHIHFGFSKVHLWKKTKQEVLLKPSILHWEQAAPPVIIQYQRFSIHGTCTTSHGSSCGHEVTFCSGILKPQPFFHNLFPLLAKHVSHEHFSLYIKLIFVFPPFQPDNSWTSGPEGSQHFLIGKPLKRGCTQGVGFRPVSGISQPASIMFPTGVS